MSLSSTNVVHTETMQLDATPAQTREFITTPDRILDYFPDPVEGGVFEPGKAIYCRGEIGTSLLERIESECNENRVVLKVTTAIGLAAPFTRERIEENATFTMIEDWDLAPNGTGTTLTKTWREVTAIGPAPFPLEEAVREGAIHECDSLVQGWNRAAAQA